MTLLVLLDLSATFSTIDYGTSMDYLVGLSALSIAAEASYFNLLLTGALGLVSQLLFSYKMIFVPCFHSVLSICVSCLELPQDWTSRL